MQPVNGKAGKAHRQGLEPNKDIYMREIQRRLKKKKDFVLRWVWQSGLSYLQEASPFSWPTARCWRPIPYVVSRPVNRPSVETTTSTSTWVPDDTICLENTGTIDALRLSITIWYWMSNKVNRPGRSKGTRVVWLYCSSTRARRNEGNRRSKKGG